MAQENVKLSWLLGLALIVAAVIFTVLVPLEVVGEKLLQSREPAGSPTSQHGVAFGGNAPTWRGLGSQSAFRPDPYDAGPYAITKTEVFIGRSRYAPLHDISVKFSKGNIVNPCTAVVFTATISGASITEQGAWVRISHSTIQIDLAEYFCIELTYASSTPDPDLFRDMWYVWYYGAETKEGDGRCFISWDSETTCNRPAQTFAYRVYGVKSGGNNGPQAGFSFTLNFLQVTFTDTSQPGDASINEWSWVFGDGTTSDDQNPVKTYAAAGTYLVSLTVSDTSGFSSTSVASVTVVAVGGGAGGGGGGGGDPIPTTTPPPPKQKQDLLLVGALLFASGITVIVYGYVSMRWALLGVAWFVAFILWFMLANFGVM